MIVFDGKKRAEEIASDLKKEIERKGLNNLKLAVIRVGDDPVVSTFIKQKEKYAQYLGVGFKVFSLPASLSFDQVAAEVRNISLDVLNSGVIVQLPLPSGMPAEEILNCIPVTKDVDVLSKDAFDHFSKGKFDVLPPVVGAVREVLDAAGVNPNGRKVVLVGRGRLVGKPLGIWLRALGAEVEELGSDSSIEPVTLNADIIISGVGKPNLIKGDMIKRGAVVVDAGTSEEGGKVVGDVDRVSIGARASFFSPVPGGVGPLTVVMIFKNLLLLNL